MTMSTVSLFVPWEIASAGISRQSAANALLRIALKLAMKPFIIGIAGGTGSGKSTVARKVAAALDADSVAFIDMDAYYNDYAHLSMDERRHINWDHPNAFDWDLFHEQLRRLSRGEP